MKFLLKFQISVYIANFRVDSKHWFIYSLLILYFYKLINIILKKLKTDFK